MGEVPIRDPRELNARSVESLRGLAEDLRQRIISISLKNGGHLGASLGAVELAIALHAVFESPEEPIVWDVGHQAYAHKLITGRWKEFETLRLQGGTSGFLSRKESPHDVWGAGHSSTSLSAALAIAAAKGRSADESWTVAVIGDGGLTAGLAFEALNQVAGIGPLAPMLVVLNDNQMSISPNVGSIPAELFRLFGFDYVGPVDGHHLESLLGTLKGIRTGYSGRPILLHALTEKGRGYAPAEQRPAAYHGVAAVPAKIPEPSAGLAPASWSQAFGEALCGLAEKDPKIVAITAAMGEGTGLSEFARRFPQRFFDVGIAEAHAVTFAAGLATQGLRPVVAVYSTFLQRAFDSLIHDVALQRLGVTFAVDRAGIVGADGPTHHGAFDLAYLGLIPEMTVSAPVDDQDLGTLLAQATSSGRPFAIRYPRGSVPSRVPGRQEGGVRWLKEDSRPRLFVLGVGTAAVRALEAAGTAARTAVLGVVKVKPIPERLISALEEFPDAAVLTVEDGTSRGGFGESLRSALAHRKAPFAIAAYGDHFITQGSPGALEEIEGLSARALQGRIEDLLSRALA
jgi:1-deoxy-D-xylulose-5-phosphate synthase